MSQYKPHSSADLEAPKECKIGIVVSQYNPEITETLLESCRDELVERGVLLKNIQVIETRGAFELPYACQQLAKSKNADAIIALGAIIKGETPHFDFIAFGVAHGIMEVSLKFDLPVIFGVLTPNNMRQAKARIRGGSKGDKGIEAALTALQALTIHS